MQFRHACRHRTLTAQNHNNIPVQIACLIGCLDLGLGCEYCRRGADDMPCLDDGGCLDHRLAKIAIQHFQPTIDTVRVGCRAQNVTIAGHFQSCAPDEIASIEKWLARIVMQIVTTDCFGAPIKKAAFKQFSNNKPHATSGMKMIHIGAAIWIDSGKQRSDLRKIGKILPGEIDPGCCCHRRQMQCVIGGTAGCMQSDNGIYKAALIQHFANGLCCALLPGQLNDTLGCGNGERVP